MDIKKALQQLCDDVKSILKERIHKYGINPKTGTNTLEGSELERSLQVIPTDNGFELQIADYWEHLARGWKRTGNYPGTMRLFVYNINDWIRRKGIIANGITQNQLAWAIIKNIWDKGLRARPFMVYDEEGDLSKMIPELDGLIDKWMDELFDEIMNDLNKYFNE